jgi:hypothetical protein
LRAAISEITEGAFARHIKSYCEGQVRHSRHPLHQRIRHTPLKYIGHALGAGYLMRQNSGRTLACGSSHLAHPYADTLAQLRAANSSRW